MSIVKSIKTTKTNNSNSNDLKDLAKLVLENPTPETIKYVFERL